MYIFQSANQSMIGVKGREGTSTEQRSGRRHRLTNYPEMIPIMSPLL